MIRVLIISAACAFVCDADAQFSSVENTAGGGLGGGGFGGGGNFDPVFGAAGVIQSGSLTIVVPESKDAVLALGSKGWVKQEIDKQDGLDIVPVVADNAAAVKYGNKMYAFSAKADRWAAIKLSPNSNAVPVVSSHSIWTRDGDLYHAFTLPSGRWSTVNLKTGEVN